MLRVRIGPQLSEASTTKLAELQQSVDEAESYSQRVEAAKKRWGGVEKNAPPFDEVRRVLDQLCYGARRCCYCEDSVADEIEHVRPKDLYPDLVFAWQNYLYACGPCNAPKSNRFAVLLDASTVPTAITRQRGGPVEPPPAGVAALIDPRTEDPLDYLILDIVESFRFRARPRLAERDRARAEYTIDLLALNTREYLVEARRTSYAALANALEAAAIHKERGKEVEHPKRAIQKTAHRSVWEEMKRQAQKLAELQPLFAAVPEAHDW